MLSTGSGVNRHIFTRRNRAILILIAEGYTNKEIADELYVSEQTVRENQANLMRKVNAPNLSSLIHYALVNGFISVYEVLERRFSKRKSEVNRIGIADNR